MVNYGRHFQLENMFDRDRGMIEFFKNQFGRNLPFHQLNSNF